MLSHLGSLFYKLSPDSVSFSYLLLITSWKHPMYFVVLFCLPFHNVSCLRAEAGLQQACSFLCSSELSLWEPRAAISLVWLPRDHTAEEPRVGTLVQGSS